MKTILSVLFLFSAWYCSAQDKIPHDVIPTNDGDLTIYFVGHGTLMFKYHDLIIHADASSREADYSQMPDADLILVTHHHGDHFDPEAIDKIRTENTTIILNGRSSDEAPDLEGKVVLKNGEKTEYKGILIEAVPAYNLVHMRSEGNPYHPKGEGNGYVVTFGDKRVFIAGDTENTPEMKALKNIDIAFLPMNLPYTMTPEMVADAIIGFRPDIFYPYHYGSTDPQLVVDLLKDENDIEVRVRDMP